MAHGTRGRILSPLLFNIFLCNIYAGDNAPNSTNINLEKVLHDLEKMSNISLKWFTDNLQKASPENSHLLTNSAEETHWWNGHIQQYM